MRVTIVSPFDPVPGPGPGPAPARGRGKGRPARGTGAAHVGGVERVLHRMAHEVARRGHEVTLLCSTSGPGGEARDGPVRVVRVHRRATAFRAPLARLASRLPGGQDLVHVPATYPFTTGPVLRTAAKQRVASVLDFHFEAQPPGLAGDTAARAWAAWGPRSYALADAVAVRSLAYARAAPSLRGVDPRRVRVVPNGLDPREFRPRPEPSEGRHLLFVGRLVPYKGVDVLLRALARMRRPPPLVVAGDGPEMERLQGMARRLRVDARFLGHVPDEALPLLYRGARLTVLPSVNRQEAFGITLVESMACGTPVVASRLPGVAEVAGQGGLLAEPRDPASLADALERALASVTMPRGAALAGPVRARYAWPAVASQLLDVYELALAHRRGEAPEEVRSDAHPRGVPILRA